LNNKDINERELRVFITAITEYFQALAGEPAHVRPAYLGTDLSARQSYDYTCLITISGNYRGCVYFSCRQVLLRRLLVCMGENDHSESNLLDAVGEVANTISGNAWKHFGATLEISVPVTINEPTESIRAAVRPPIHHHHRLAWSGGDCDDRFGATCLASHAMLEFTA